MKKNIPFNKDITFNTNIYEINSISLEHNLKIDNNIISGEFILSGDYREYMESIKNEPFIFNIPFNIDLDKKYDTSNVKIDIDNFNYELVGDNTLNINIILNIDNLDVIDDEEVMIEAIDEDKTYDITDVYEINEVQNRNKEEKKEEKKEEIIEVKESEPVTSIFNNFSDKDDTYITYHVHIFREDDSLEEIVNKYNTTKEELCEYNDLDSIKYGSKIIIPSYEQL